LEILWIIGKYNMMSDVISDFHLINLVVLTATKWKMDIDHKLEEQQWLIDVLDGKIICPSKSSRKARILLDEERSGKLQEIVWGLSSQ